MGNLLSRYNERETYGLKSKNTGKIVATFRNQNTAVNMKSKYEKEYIEELEVVLL